MKQLGLNDFYNKIQLHNKKKIIGKSAVPFLRNKKVPYNWRRCPKDTIACFTAFGNHDILNLVCRELIFNA